MSDHQKQRNWFARHKVLTVVLALVVIGVIGSAAGGGNKTETANTSTNTAKEEAKPEPTPTKWDIEAAYAKVNNGMTKAQVEAATGKKSDSCTESQSEYIGKTELCTYGNPFTDKGSIMVTYSQDVVSSKTKSTY